MATWKKIIVSGSDAHLNSVTASNSLSVDTNQIITTTQAGTKLTGSFTGSFVGDGTGLTGVTATAIFPTTAKTPIVGTDQVYINDGANKYATVSQFTSASWAGISGDVLINGSGVASIQPDSVVLGTDTQGNYVATVSASDALVSSATTGEGSTPNITLNTGSAHFTQGVVKGLPSGTISGSSLSSPFQGLVALTTNGVTQASVDLGLETTDSPQFVDVTLTGNANVNGGSLTTTAGTFNVVTSTATTINVGTVGAGILNFGNAQSTSSFNGDVIVKGDLIVQGDVTEIQVANLNVEDQFIFLGSGSNGNVDTGIVVQSGSTAGIGEALFWDAPYQRWAVAHQVASTAVSVTPAGYVTITQEGSGDPSAGPTNPVFGTSAGKGEIYIRDNGEIWIYS